eukprot:11675068-Alexandrium_andersonii.AAC.1
MHDQEEFEIAAIVAHQGDKRRRDSMWFLVKWKGYDDSYDSWLPYANLRDTEQLLDYLRLHKMKSLINPKHRKMPSGTAKDAWKTSPTEKF